MKKNILLSLCLLLALSTFGQPGGENRLPHEKKEKPSAEKRKEIEAQKVAYITTQLELTPEESAAFWPVYNAYHTELEALKKSNKKSKQPGLMDTDNMSDSEIDAEIKKVFEQKKKMVDLEIIYYEKFKQVLPTTKVAAFYKANKDFRTELLRSLRDRSEVERRESNRHRSRAHEKHQSKEEKSLLD